MTELKWVQIECPECGLLGEAAATDPHHPPPRYSLCPGCRKKNTNQEELRE